MNVWAVLTGLNGLFFFKRHEIGRRLLKEDVRGPEGEFGYRYAQFFVY